MPHINRPRTNRPATSTTSTTATTGPAAPAAPATSDATPAADAAPVPSGAGRISNQPPKATINGLKGLTTTFDTMATNRFGADTSFTAGSGSDAVKRGYIEVEPQAIPGGVRVTVNTFHKDKNDKMTLVLMAEVLDLETNQLRTINLSVLTNKENINGDKYRGSRTFDVSYADVNKFLQARNPNLKINPGHTSLSVMAMWNNDSGGVRHRAGGPARGGSFRTPLPEGAQSPTSTRIGAMTGNQGDATDLPLDMQVGYAPDLVATYPMLKDGGAIVSRLESEFKGTTDKAKMTAAVHKMYGIVEASSKGDHSQIEKLLGKGWSISTVNRYWIKDDGSSDKGKPGTGFFAGFRVGDDGLPLQDPMSDAYMDNKNLTMTRHEGAVRLRKNKQATFINVKPGGGRLDDKTGIRQRVEVGLELKADADTDDVAGFLRGVATNGKWANTVFNHAEREVKKLDSQLELAEALDPFMQITQDRHKFTVKNEKTGVEIEFSFDFVTAETLRPTHADRNGKPRKIEFCVLEGELDHLQLQSQNQNSFQAAGAGTGSFSTDDAQDDWLKTTGSKVTMDIDPRLHELEDLENKSFRGTDSYKQFEGANGKLLPFLFPDGLNPGKQKAAHAADLLDMNPDTEAGAERRLEFALRGFGLDWTDDLAAAFDKLADKDGGLDKLNQQLDQDWNGQDPAALVKKVFGRSAPKLVYDHRALSVLVDDTLESVGLDSNKGIRDMLKQLDTKKLAPKDLHRLVGQLRTGDEGKALAELAQKAGVSPAPSATINVDKLAEAEKIDAQMKQGWVAPGDKDAIMTLLRAAKRKGASAYQLRRAIQSLNYYADSGLKTLATAAGGLEVPALHTDPTQFIDGAKAQLANNHVVFTPELETFLADVANQTSPDKARNLYPLSRADYQKWFTEAAQRIGVTPPSISVDKAAVHNVLKGAAGEIGVSYNSSLRTYVEKALDAGAAAQTLNQVVRSLRHNTADEAIKRYQSSGGLPDVAAPKVKYLKAHFEAAYQEQAKQVFFSDEDKLFDKLWALVDDAGNPPQDVLAVMSDLSRSNDLKKAVKSRKLEVPDGLYLSEGMRWDTNAIVDSLKTSGQIDVSALNAETETWMGKALRAAAKKDKLDPSALRWSNLPQVIKRLETWSGLTAPAQG